MLSNSWSMSTPSVEFLAGILVLLRMSLKLSEADREVWNDFINGAFRRGAAELALCRNIEVEVVRNVDVYAILEWSIARGVRPTKKSILVTCLPR